mmetsp:Transcript_2959/g.4241  ORF Transcript_2959/g.4241 Transcript_2959/m.4241 type:complete len:153 (+) Transcript_2959:216-674(+)
MEGFCRKAPGSALRAFTAKELSFDINEFCGIYQRGKEYPLQKCLEVAGIYAALKMAVDGGADVSARRLAKEAKNGRNFARKIKDKVDSIEMKCRSKRKNTGMGSLSLSGNDEVKQLEPRIKNPYRSLRSYRNNLFSQDENRWEESFSPKFEI